MSGSALIVIAAFAAAGAAAAAAALASRRRRSRRAHSLGARLDPAPAGLKALASSVSDLSDLGVHLASRVPPPARKAKLGVLLGLR